MTWLGTAVLSPSCFRCFLDFFFVFFFFGASLFASSSQSAAFYLH